MEPAQRWTCLWILASCCLAAPAALADDAISTVTDQVTVVATRGERPLLETPGAVSVIDAEELERQAAQDLRDLLRFEPALQIEGDPSRFGLGAFVVRGIGGNRVQTLIDGVPTGEEFSFGPLGTPRMGLDLDLLSQVELVKNGGSSLYGSDALGGLIAFITKDPMDLVTREAANYHLGARLGWDGRQRDWASGLSAALVEERWQTSLVLSRRQGHETDNFGVVDSQDALRTTPNPQERLQVDGLAKLLFLPSPQFVLKLGVETFDGESETEVFSSRGVQDLSRQFPPGTTYRIATEDFDADDERQRRRFALDLHSAKPSPLFDRWQAKAYWQDHRMEQDTLEQRATTVGGPLFGPLRTTRVARGGLFEFEQKSWGGEAQFDQETALGRWVYGFAHRRDQFDTLRDLRDVNLATGLPVVGSTPYPTKYFPRSESAKTGAFVQAELDLGAKLRLTAGLRFDRYTLDADPEDPIYLAGNPGTPVPVDSTDQAWSPRLALVWQVGSHSSLFVQGARGFRAPPFSDINAGFTNLAFGYTQLPAPDLDPEISENYEIGWRWQGKRVAGSVTAFSNRYAGFIETVALGTNPETLLLEYQARNLADARIEGLEAQGQLQWSKFWRARGALAWTEGENRVSLQPLNSIGPSRGVLGLGFHQPAWSLELIGTFVARKSPNDLDRTVVAQFSTPSYQVFDLAFFWEIAEPVSLQVGLWNLLDDKVWDWGNVQGLSQQSGVLDRYSSPGRAATLALRWRR